MAKKKTKKYSKKQLTFIAVALIIIIVALSVCYFFIPEFKKRVDDYFASILGDGSTITNTPKGESELRIHFLDIGQGDSIFIELPDDTTMLIDSGNGRNNGETTESKYIVDYISSLGVSTIDYLVVTHADTDHSGNMTEVLKEFEVEKAYVPDLDITSSRVSQTYKRFYNALLVETYGNGNSCQIEISSEFDVIESEKEDTEFCILFLAPKEYYYGDALDEPNFVSSIMLLEYMSKRVLFTGDAIKEGEQILVSDYLAGMYSSGMTSSSGKVYGVNLENIDILKVGHHGSNTSSCQEFLDLLKPKYSIISCGVDNSYDHPHDEVMQRLLGINSVCYRTDILGTIVATIYPDVQKVIAFSFDNEGNLTALSVFVTNSKNFVLPMKKENI